MIFDVIFEMSTLHMLEVLKNSIITVMASVNDLQVEHMNMRF